VTPRSRAPRFFFFPLFTYRSLLLLQKDDPYSWLVFHFPPPFTVVWDSIREFCTRFPLIDRVFSAGHRHPVPIPARIACSRSFTGSPFCVVSSTGNFSGCPLDPPPLLLLCPVFFFRFCHLPRRLFLFFGRRRLPPKLVVFFFALVESPSPQTARPTFLMIPLVLPVFFLPNRLVFWRACFFFLA